MAKPAPVAIPTEPIGSIPTYCLSSLIDLNNLALSRFSPEDRRRTGVRSCAGSDFDTLRPPRRSARPFVRTRQELALVIGRGLIIN
jgi:hypothetical protein